MKIKGIPSSETNILRRVTTTGEAYVITVNNATQMYTIYKLNGDTAVKLGKGSNPLELEQKYVVD